MEMILKHIQIPVIKINEISHYEKDNHLFLFYGTTDKEEIPNKQIEAFLIDFDIDKEKYSLTLFDCELRTQIENRKWFTEIMMFDNYQINCNVYENKATSESTAMISGHNLFYEKVYMIILPLKNQQTKH